VFAEGAGDEGGVGVNGPGSIVHGRLSMVTFQVQEQVQVQG